MNSLGLEEKYQSAQTVESLFQFHTLNDLRERYLAETPQIPQADLPAYERLTVELNRHRQEASQRSRALLDIVQKDSTLSESAYEQALVLPNLTDEQKKWLQSHVQRQENFVAYAQATLTDLQRSLGAPGEHAGSEGIQPRLSKNFVCGVAGGLIVGGILSGNAFAIGFGIGLALGAGC